MKEIKIEESKLRKKRKILNKFKNKANIRKEIKNLKELHAKKDQETYMVDMRIKELERFIKNNCKPKFPTANEKEGTEDGDNISSIPFYSIIFSYF